MQRKFFTSCLASLALLFSASVFADTKITEVANDSTATNGCTVNSIAGGGGGNSYYTIYRVACASATVYTQKTTSYGNCTMSSTTNGFTTSSSCGNYSVYQTTPPASSSSAPSSSASSSSVSGPVTITRVINDISNNGCYVRSVAGGNNYIIWAIDCAGYNSMSVQKTTTYGVCSVTSSTTGFTVQGTCSEYRVIKQ